VDTTSQKTRALDDPLITELLEVLERLAGPHPGFRPVHAKGIMCSGRFTPGPDAAALTRAPHAGQDSTPVIVRFSDLAGLPTIADNAPNGASPRGIAIRFTLGPHAHTDIIGHSYDGFPTRTGEEFLELNRAVIASGPGASKPTPIESFLSTHPKALEFVQAPKPIPTSFAREAFFALTAFRFTNNDGVSRYGRFRIRPDAGTEYLSDADAAKKSPNFLMDELGERLARGPVRFHVRVQIAGGGDDTADATVRWPDDRPEMEFGTVALTTRLNADDPEFQRIIFDPIPRVDGIDPSDDPLIQVRSALYLLSGRRRRAAAATR
jgi:catalase